MNHDISTVLKPEHCALCNQVLQAGAKNAAVIEACKRCGLPVEDIEAQQQAITKMASNIKREFFPHNS